MSASVRTTLQTVPEAIPTDHVSKNKVRSSSRSSTPHAQQSSRKVSNVSFACVLLSLIVSRPAREKIHVFFINLFHVPVDLLHHEVG
ncbi:hypothetical protein FHG87_000382 [Trinorchestia longiramus]|nr:hypothetical protein FHG87_000382 [Trinorchestia longiramus]